MEKLEMSWKRRQVEGQGWLTQIASPYLQASPSLTPRLNLAISPLNAHI